MARLPSLFISHGAPDLPIRTGATQDFLRQMAKNLPTPRAILVVSAHWHTDQPTVSKVIQPQTIYDFGGFPPELYQLSYPAPGAPALADQVVAALIQASFSAQTHPTRGLDHGAWTPLILVYPDAAIPVTQLSLQADQTPEHHFRIGQALVSLRDEGVLIVGSGAATHNLDAFSADYEASTPNWATAFDDWLAKTIHENDVQRLFAYQQLAPYATRNHPTKEHLLPLFVALGAGGPGRQLHQGFTYGAFSMASYAFE